MDDADLAKQLMEDLEYIDAPRINEFNGSSYATHNDMNGNNLKLPKLSDTKIVIESAPPQVRN